MTLKFPLSRFIVKDKSMEPFLYDGDHVLTFNWAMLKVGSVIVYRFFANAQNDNAIYYIKRVKKISGERVTLEGDNKSFSSKMAPINISQITGKVILKY